MSFFTNICHPRQQYLDKQRNTQTYKHINDYIFESRNLQKIKFRNQGYYDHNQSFIKQQKYLLDNKGKFDMRYGNGVKNNDENYYCQSNKRNISSNRNNNLNAIFNHHHQHQHQNQNNDNSGYKQNSKLSFKQITQGLCNGQLQKRQNQCYYPHTQQNQKQNHINLRQTPYFMTSSAQNFQNFQKNQQTNHRHYDSKKDLLKNSSYLQQLQQLSKAFLLKQNQQLRYKNNQLKKLIQEQYQPMKQIYNKLIKQQQQREYLVSKLEWKVKQLVKQVEERRQNGMKNQVNIFNSNNNNAITSTTDNTPINTNHKFKQSAVKQFNHNHNFKNSQYNNNINNHHYNNINNNMITPTKSTPIISNQFDFNVNHQDIGTSQPVINVNHHQQNNQNYYNQQINVRNNNFINTNYQQQQQQQKQQQQQQQQHQQQQQQHQQQQHQQQQYQNNMLRAPQNSQILMNLTTATHQDRRYMVSPMSKNNQIINGLSYNINTIQHQQQYQLNQNNYNSNMNNNVKIRYN